MANALTLRHKALLNCIVTPVSVVNLFEPNKKIDIKGIWDTGATNSAITEDTAKTLGLKPISKAISRAANGTFEVNVYVVRLLLGGGNIVIDQRVTECKALSADNSVGMLIGMDVICKGDFSITNFEGKTVMSFISPSQKKIDYVEELSEYDKIVKIHKEWIKHGNNKCPCGSGKKFENCHGKIRYK